MGSILEVTVPQGIDFLSEWFGVEGYKLVDSICSRQSLHALIQIDNQLQYTAPKFNILDPSEGL